MTQIAQPQLHVSALRSHRSLVLATLGLVLAASIALTLVIAIGSNQHSTAVPHLQASNPGVSAGPAEGTPSAVAQAVGVARVRSGLSLTTNLPALPRSDAGPERGTPSTVSRAFARAPQTRWTPPRSLTTNVPAASTYDAGPATGTPTAVRDAISAR